MDTVKAYGPPGCGKTHAACRWIARQVERGADPERVAFVSFTRAACETARARICGHLDLLEYEVPYCATIHALCLRALAPENRDWLAEGKKLQEFAQSYDYDLVTARPRGDAEDMEEVAGSAGEDAPFLQVWNFGRNRLITDAAAAWDAFEEYDRFQALALSYPRFLQFVRDYEEWKQSWNLRDYTDLLLAIVQSPRALPVQVAAVDESQDMTPLLWAAADVLFSRAEARLCAADDDQAVYGFQGADPRLFNDRAARETRQLQQSRRLPGRLVTHAGRIIAENRNRYPKTLLPVTPEIIESRPDRAAGSARTSELEGELHRVRSVEQLDLTGGESWMLLSRNWRFVGDLARRLEGLGIPYRIAGDQYYPWSEKGPLRAAQAIYALSEGERVPWSDVVALADKSRTETKEQPGAWVRGAKTRIKNLAAAELTGRVGLMDLPQLGLSRWGFERILGRELELLKEGISDRDLAAYQAAQRRGLWGTSPRITVSTIHGVKGGEADNVAVVPSCTVLPWRNLDQPERREEEIRLAYVAVTRARQRLFVLDEDLGGKPYEVFGL